MKPDIKSSEKIRVGVIGCGPVTLNAHADAIAKAANIELQAIADRDEVLLTEMKERLRPARTYRDADDLLNDPRVELVSLRCTIAFMYRWSARRSRQANMFWSKSRWGSPLKNVKTCGIR